MSDTDYGHPCSPTEDCTAHNLHCGYPDCAKGKREGIHAAIGTPAMSSDTPRTDAELKFHGDARSDQASVASGMTMFARQLERDLAAANAALAGMKQAITDPENQPSQYGTVTLAMYEASDKRAHAWAEELAAANARAERAESALRECIQLSDEISVAALDVNTGGGSMSRVRDACRIYREWRAKQ